MKKTSNKPFEKIFDDIGELDILRDDESIYRIKGHATLNNTLYQISITRNDPPCYISPNEITSACGKSNSGDSLDKKVPKKPLYTGTISIISLATNRVLISEAKRRKKNVAGKACKDKNFYASIKFSCNCADENILASTLRRRVDTLYCENEDQLTAEWAKSMTPDQVTPSFAADKYVDDYLSLTCSISNPDLYNAKKRKIQSVLRLLPNFPFSMLTARDVSAILKKENVPSGNIEMCYLFMEYLINHEKCTGKNPFPSESTKPISYNKLNKSAFSPQELSNDVFAKMFQLLNNKLSTVYCGITLLASGFTLTDIDSLTWGDIEFVPGYGDFAIVHIRRDQLLVAKHDFSRPAIPDTARYLRRVYNFLCEEHGTESVNKWNVVVTEHSRNKALPHKDLAEAVNNILVRAGHVGRLTGAGRPNVEKEPIPVSLLRTNYQRRLFSQAGLANDADTANFLSGISLKSSTFTNYESHTSAEAQYRLYKILKPISVEAPLKRYKKEREANTGLIYTAAPKTNHEIVSLTGTIKLKPGDEITIRIPSGAHGRIRIIHHDP